LRIPKFMKPLVSILIPAYNAEPWIADTIQSALNQTWPEKEIIVVVDDGSKDQTFSVANQFASKMVKVVRRPHQFAAAARNEAYSLSQGDYIQWLDADDLLAPDKISCQMQRTSDPGQGMLSSSAWGYFDFRTSKAIFRPTPLWCDLSPQEWLIRKMGKGDHMQPATWLISREISEAAGPWNEKIFIDEDGEYFCRVVLASKGIRFSPDAKVFYRRSGGSYTVRTLFRMDERWLSTQLQFDHLRSLGDSEQVRTACRDYLQIWLVYFYPERPDILEAAQKLAYSIGMKLEIPVLRWKYQWIAKMFGYQKAKRAQFLLPQFKANTLRIWDKTMYNLETLGQLKHERKSAS
jgi:glycosyltransferase involved in cell wall biosynthesis